jgi:hypothetical protein
VSNNLKVFKQNQFAETSEFQYALKYNNEGETIALVDARYASLLSAAPEMFTTLLTINTLIVDAKGPISVDNVQQVSKMLLNSLAKATGKI